MMKDKNGNRNKRFLWRCHDCKKQYTVRIGTIMEDSRVPIRIWCHAFWRACASKKGVSALQISRECNITYKTALFLMHRIRYAMAKPEPESKFEGIVEIDETYVGGKPRKRVRHTKWSNKTPVLAIIERGGKIRVRHVTKVTAKNLRETIDETVNKDKSRLCTDQLGLYKPIGREFAHGHGRVQHNKWEYAKGKDHCNTCESFFALLKRGVYGTFHAVSKKHLHRYCDEFAFRWETRGLNDGERIVSAILGGEGKRLTYYEPVKNTG